MGLPKPTFCLGLLCTALLLGGPLLIPPASAQSAPGDSLSHSQGYNAAVTAYHTYLTPESALYHGSQYVDYTFLISESYPYFNDTHLQKGTVLYDGIQYQQVLLLYDLVKDQLVIGNPFTLYKIVLFSGLVDKFSIGQFNFCKLTDSLTPGAPHPGFYQQLYKGRVTLLRKQRKTIRDELSTGVIRYLIDSSESFYLRKDNRYYSVNTRGALLTVLKDKSKAVKNFIRTNELSIRKDRENSLTKIIAWYDGQNP